MIKTGEGLDVDRLQHLREVIAADIAADKYFGAVISVARNGKPALQEAFGYADGAHQRRLNTDSVFSLFSLTKAFTTVLTLRAIELGQFALTTRVVEIIPEFCGGQREKITFFHLLTHTSGLPALWIPKPGMYIDRLDEIIAAICENIRSVEVPGQKVHYSPLFNHALMGEAVRRCDPKGRSYRQLLQDEVLTPLGMKDTAIGMRPDLRERHIFPDFRGKPPQEHLGRSNLGPQGAFLEEHAEMPWVGGISSMPDLFLFSEMLRCGGTLNGARILSPAMIDMATRNWTGDKPNELYKAVAINHGWEPYPGYIGLGFCMRGEAMCPGLFGTLTTPRTFGNYGSGSTLFWVDPELDLSFVCVSAGIMQQAQNIERFQRLSDIVVSAAL
ncbi:MAG: serine hydrolase domain-containing protein [Pseudomonadota bacterium]